MELFCSYVTVRALPVGHSPGVLLFDSAGLPRDTGALRTSTSGLKRKGLVLDPHSALLTTLCASKDHCCAKLNSSGFSFLFFA